VAAAHGNTTSFSTPPSNGAPCVLLDIHGHHRPVHPPHPPVVRPHTARQRHSRHIHGHRGPVRPTPPPRHTASFGQTNAGNLLHGWSSFSPPPASPPSIHRICPPVRLLPAAPRHLLYSLFLFPPCALLLVHVLSVIRLPDATPAVVYGATARARCGHVRRDIGRRFVLGATAPSKPERARHGGLGAFQGGPETMLASTAVMQKPTAAVAARFWGQRCGSGVPPRRAPHRRGSVTGGLRNYGGGLGDSSGALDGGAGAESGRGAACWGQRCGSCVPPRRPSHRRGRATGDVRCFGGAR